MNNTKKGLLERLKTGVVIGDGGFVAALERRGYVAAGPWTPECTVQYPEAVRQLHREYLRAGADVMQTFTFYASDDKLERESGDKGMASKPTGLQINQAACDLAHQVAAEGDALVAGGISETPSYQAGKEKDVVQQEFQKQVDVFIRNKVDFLICEYFEYVEEMEWAIEVCKRSGLPVCSTMTIGPLGDLSGVSTGDCALRMARAGADVVGLNCHFGPTLNLEALKLMKAALDASDIDIPLMTQPLSYHVPEANKHGFMNIPEFPFALEPRVATRWEIQKWARECYEVGARYIGGCCGFEPYHIRAIAQELAPERGCVPAGSEKHAPWGGALVSHRLAHIRARATREYWENLKPCTGRPLSTALSTPL